MATVYELEPRGHVWKRDGEYLEIFAYTAGTIHNGPRCVNCGYGFCHHCHEGPEEDCRNPQTPTRTSKE